MPAIFKIYLLIYLGFFCFFYFYKKRLRLSFLSPDIRDVGSFICFSHYTSGYWADLGFAWSCPLACLGRADMAEPAVVRLIQMIDAISAEIEDTMLTTATASASEDVEAGAKWLNTTHPLTVSISLLINAFQI